MSAPTVYLSPPYLSGKETGYFNEALASGWIAPYGPQLDAFEAKIATFCEVPFALATQSGTAALHLALVLSGVGSGDTVVCPTFTFAALPSMIMLTGASPVFIDVEAESWNLSYPLTEAYLHEAARSGKLPKAVILVHNYGIMADAQAFKDLCSQYEVTLIEDAAEALGSERGTNAGSAGHYGVLSFNGNKLITTGGGGALLVHSKNEYEVAKKLSLQSKEAEIHYEHHAPGFNYRMNNVAAAFGLAQMADIAWRIEQKKIIADTYQQELAHLVSFQRSQNPGDVRWLSAFTAPTAWKPVYEALLVAGFESRPLWKPLHLQRAYRQHVAVEGETAEKLFNTGLCLPSGVQLTESQQSSICEIIKRKLGSR